MTRINTNIPALTAMGRLRVNSNDLATRLERLSTGLRINRGKDDPAGLIASETLRKEMRGISQAIDNSVRAINVLSTAEGALNEVSSLLLDLKALVVETANEGALSDEEIQANQLEIDSILFSIDRIAHTTQFGGKKLLNGQLSYNLSAVDTGALAHTAVYGARLPEGSTKSVVVQVLQSAETALLSFDATATGGVTSAVTVEVAGSIGTDILSFQSGATVSEIATAVNAITATTGVSATVNGNVLTLNSTRFGSDEFVSVKSVNGTFLGSTVVTGTTSTDYGEDANVLVNGQAANTHGLRVDIRTMTLDARFYLTPEFGQATSQTSFEITGGGALFQIGPEVTPQAQLNVGLGSVSTGNLGNTVIGYLNTIRSGGDNEVSQGNFTSAEEIVTESINQVAVLRGRLGSLQKNQIETNINSQQVALENVTASESAIRDADIAVEVSALTRAQILFQATQLTLGIANQMPQAALSLLG